MYRGTTPALSSEQESDRAVHDLARLLRLEAEAVESVRERLRGAEGIDWDSPAGRTFRSYLSERAATVAAIAGYLREVALSLDAYGVALTNARQEGTLG